MQQDYKKEQSRFLDILNKFKPLLESNPANFEMWILNLDIDGPQSEFKDMHMEEHGSKTIVHLTKWCVSCDK